MSDASAAKDRESPTKDKKTWRQWLDKWVWRTAGSVLWIWLADACLLKLRSAEFVGTPNIVLLFVVVPYIICAIQRDGMRAMGLSAYLIVFPIIAPFLAAWYITLSLMAVGEALWGLFKAVRFLLRPSGTIVVGLLLVATQIAIAMELGAKVAIPLGIASLIWTTLIVLSLLRYVLDPYAPIRSLRGFATELVQGFVKDYCNRIVREPVRAGQVKRLEKARKDLKRVHQLLSALGGSRWRRILSGKRVAIPAFLFSVVVSLAVIVIGFGGALHSWNGMPSVDADLETTPRWFSAVKADTSYGEHVYFTFTLLTTTQPLKLDETSLEGRLFSVAVLLSGLIVLTVCVTTFFALINSEQDVSIVDLHQLTTSELDRVASLQKEVETALTIARGRLLPSGK